MFKLLYWRDLLLVLAITLCLVGTNSYADDEEAAANEAYNAEMAGLDDEMFSNESLEEYYDEGSEEYYEEPSDEETTSGNQETTNPPTGNSTTTTGSSGGSTTKPDKTNVKVTLCHNGSETITVAEESVINAHLKHGDTIGACSPATNKPSSDSTTGKPSTDKPSTDTGKPTTDKPSTNKPATDKPSTDKPSTNKPTEPVSETVVTPPVTETQGSNTTPSETTSETQPTEPESETVTVETPLPQCTTDKQCPRGEVCESNACVPICKRLGCCNDGDCPSGKICENSECVAASRCVFNSDCGSSQECRAGLCAAVTLSFDSSYQCQASENCGTSEFCIKNQCISCSLLSCCTDGNCSGKNKKCCDGNCQQCCSNSDCRNGSCIDGKCQSSELAVLASFDATPSEKTMLLTWETAAELDNAGFHIWRAQVKDGQYVDITRLTSQLLPSKSMMDWLGASYHYEDTTALPGITYYYALEDIDFYGVSTVHLDMVASAMIKEDAVSIPSRQQASKPKPRRSGCAPKQSEFLILK